MIWPRSLGTLIWLLVTQGLVASAEDFPACQSLAQYDRGVCCMVDQPDLPCPKPISEKSTHTSDGPEPSVTCKAPEDCSLPDCTGEGKIVACQSGTCKCDTKDGGQSPPTPTFVPTQVTKEEGDVATVIIVHGGPITSPITLTSAPSPTIDVEGDPFHSTLVSISSQVETGILPLVTAWADKPDATKATKAIQAIETLLPAIGEIANGLPDGQKIFDCPALAATAKRQSSQEVVPLLQRINCGLLKIFGGLEEGQSSTDPAVVGPAQEDVRAGEDTIKSDWDALEGIIGSATPPTKTNEGETSAKPTVTCAADKECASLPNCDGDGKEKVCQKSQCSCKSPGSTPTPTPTPSAATCTEDGQCASVPDCEGEGKKKVCQDSACVCKTDGEATVSTTMTTLPPGARIETITASVTENMITTTSSSGDDDPTIVPIIVPIGKPPVICWGCVPFPSNIELQLPEFCIQILGMKIGNCPSDNKDKDKYEEMEKEKETKTEEKTASSTTSCSTTVTATYASVFCTVTSEPGQSEKRKLDKGCSTLEYETKTACDTIAASATTTTTTVGTEPTICSPQSCGGGGCPKAALVKRAPPEPKSQPNAYSWFGPEHYTNKFEFMRSEVYKAYQDASSSVNLNADGNRPIVTGRWMKFGEDVKTVAIAGLWGCTSVIAVSKRGVWMSHFWEDQVGMVLDTFGAWENGPSEFLNRGLGSLRGGDGPEGNMFDDDAEPHVFVVTRGERPGDRANFGEAGDAWLVRMIKADLDEWWRRGNQNPGPQTDITYDPLVPEITDWQDPRHTSDPEFMTFRGKAMVQYQPAIVCGGGGLKKIAREAGYRVWVEANKPEDGEKHWEPSGDSAKDQIKVLENLKRQDDDICSEEASPGGGPGGSDGQDGKDDPSKTSSPPPQKTCSADSDCSGSECAGGGMTSFCDAGACGCRTSKTTPPLSKKKCSSNSDCSGPECTGGKVQYLCEEGSCVCKNPEDTGACTTADTCGHLECKPEEEKACADGRCRCVEKKCSNADGCGFLSCSDGQEKACKDGKCGCKDKEKPNQPPFQSGVCNTHIRTYGSENHFLAKIIVYDGAGKEVYRNNDINEKHSWGDTITLKDDKLPYPMKYEFLDEWLGKIKKRDRPPPGSMSNPTRYQAYSVRITADKTVWSTEDEDEDKKRVPRCEVGRWDTHGTWDPAEIFDDAIESLMGGNGKPPTRDMDCRWEC